VDVHRLAIATGLDFMVSGKGIPMALLVGIQASGALAKWAGVFQRRHDGLPDKLAFVGHTVNQFGQRLIHFKSNHFLFHPPMVIQGKTMVKASRQKGRTGVQSFVMKSFLMALFLSVKDAAKYQNSFAFEQDFDHPHYGGVFPEVVVFHLETR